MSIYDIAVIGAGYVGVPLAQSFAEAGKKVVLVDVVESLVEALNRGESHIGDVMADATLRFAPIARERVAPPHPPGTYVVATVHREANVRAERLRRIAEGLSRLDEPVLFPAHPRTAGVLARERIPLGANVELREPVGYLAFAAAASQARVIVTDSGGLQKEAYWYGVPCVTLRPSTEWADTVEVGANVLVDDDPDALVAAVASARFPAGAPPLYGDGRAARRIAATVASA